MVNVSGIVSAGDLFSERGPSSTGSPTPELDGFDPFWAAYPRKVAKGGARTAYARARRKVPQAVLLERLGRQITAWAARGTPWHLIPHPTTWLNQERWTDELPTARTTGMTNRIEPWLCPHTPPCPHRTACAVVAMRSE